MEGSTSRLLQIKKGVWSMTKLNKSQLESAVMAMIIGDGYLQTNHVKHPRLEISNVDRHKEYHDFKVSILSSIEGLFVNTELREKKLNDKIFKYYRSTTNCHPYLDRFINFKSGLSLDLIRRLDPLGYAILYMDEGSKEVRWAKTTKCYTRHIKIHLNRYSFKELTFIVNDLKQRFNIDSKIKETTQRNVRYFFLKLSGESMQKFLLMIFPWIVPCMKYKTEIIYVNKDSLIEGFEKIAIIKPSAPITIG